MKKMAKQKQTYIGFVEHNEWEGEDFGYYFPNTPENRQALEKFKEFLEANDCLQDYSPGYSMDGFEEAYSERDLDMIERGADNGYMARVNIVPNPEVVLSGLLLIDNIENLPYKGSFEANGEKYDLK